MTTHIEEDEHPIVEAVQANAQLLVQQLCDYLATGGWDFVCVSLSRRVDIGPGYSVAPGATGMHLHRDRMKEALGTNSAALRKMADDLDRMTDTRQAVELESYLHDKSHPTRSQWPK
jgi:hypothetical protein